MLGSANGVPRSIFCFQPERIAQEAGRNENVIRDIPDLIDSAGPEMIMRT